MKKLSGARAGGEIGERAVHRLRLLSCGVLVAEMGAAEAGMPLLPARRDVYLLIHIYKYYNRKISRSLSLSLFAFLRSTVPRHYNLLCRYTFLSRESVVYFLERGVNGFRSIARIDLGGG